MRNFIIGLIAGLLLGATFIAVADPSWIGENSIWNRVFNSTTNTIKVIGQ